MELLGIAANLIAVVEISVKILQICSQYGQGVTNAKADIAELQQEVETLYDTAKKVKTLIEGPQGTKLRASQDFALKITETLSVLSKVDAKLQPPAESSVRQRSGLNTIYYTCPGQNYRHNPYIWILLVLMDAVPCHIR
ncbi:hypothetical protein FOPG_12726 [Fusarium oxysporum f. sp. conglutinans race 2 54008]|uniref:Fungal N-terminal domain-containing protein n=1 Tax=Fusarium oxysporum f. sp. conglutinans race 2 54008 TaxID=1089457 RepID=X0H5S5_FUSOX|nr:hypothetical protein FOPG_12726 [Fusarium oxysporum f. sp. conglutinans race 2 54008]